ncbi:hypothetical protein P175DRAFT_0497227 [Aspergillus ochraceoroseus IBT 24754]|uniref:Nascent polypeptide-associated complex subunit alpha-like UBA domain-containing protein n=1 Tax=Aspergillus ochraceoroseus IBT 24754 TaxID=1392256 RepID=A0A2T5M6E9_9EURO|nr:uncharacterized protein P175DRAFT_0497227 [Aspergillus ochraceoroseus IBT 24754]PTU24110.1 hypothetical protein P175DRAFT_0497227 [Aspergillus ochraceoroseus IBT 24754]
MSDSIPSASADPESTQDHPLPANAEDRKAAAALSSLNTNEIGADSRGEGEEEGGGGGGGARGSKLPSSADQEALGKAMSRLEIAAGKGPGKKRTTEAQNKDEATEGVKKKAAVKVAADDVALLVSSFRG